jgi:hypothetical protein
VDANFRPRVEKVCLAMMIGLIVLAGLFVGFSFLCAVAVTAACILGGWSDMNVGSMVQIQGGRDVDSAQGNRAQSQSHWVRGC